MGSRKMSFHEIVRTYQRQLYWYIRRVVLVHEDSEDILQETLIKAYRHLWTLRSDNSLKPWLFKIATNEINRYFRGRREAVPADGIPDSETVEPGCISEVKVSEIISVAFTQMSPLQREVFSLRYYDDMDYDEMARITGASKNTLMVSYHNARKIIEKEVNK